MIVYYDVEILNEPFSEELVSTIYEAGLNNMLLHTENNKVLLCGTLRCDISNMDTSIKTRAAGVIDTLNKYHIKARLVIE